jgi:hypothetical protein
MNRTRPSDPAARRSLAQRLVRTGLVMAALGVVLGVLQWTGVGLPLLYAVLVCVAVVAWATPWLGVRLLDAVILAVRGRLWARDQGHFHAFAGTPLLVEDDGRAVWVGGDGLQRVLGTRDSDEVLAARLAGQWRRAAHGEMLLRVDAVVTWLTTMPRRHEPRVQKLRRYLDQDVLQPARRRRER